MPASCRAASGSSATTTTTESAGGRSLSDQERGAEALPRGGRAGTPTAGRFARRDLTLTELVDAFLERHGKVAKPATIKTLRWRMNAALDEFGDMLLSDLERMTDDLAGFAARLPERFRYAVMSALRQTCEAGVRYGYMTAEPGQARGEEPAAAPRAVRVYTPTNSTASARNSTRASAAPSGSPQLPGYVLRSGRTSNGATSTGHGGC